MYSRLSAPMELSQILLAFCTLVSCTSRACGQLSLYPFSALTGSVVDGKLQINLTFSSWSTDFSETYTLPSGLNQPEGFVFLARTEISVSHLQLRRLHFRRRVYILVLDKHSKAFHHPCTNLAGYSGSLQ